MTPATTFPLTPGPRDDRAAQAAKLDALADLLTHGLHHDDIGPSLIPALRSLVVIVDTFDTAAMPTDMGQALARRFESYRGPALAAFTPAVPAHRIVDGLAAAADLALSIGRPWEETLAAGFVTLKARAARCVLLSNLVDCVLVAARLDEGGDLHIPSPAIANKRLH